MLHRVKIGQAQTDSRLVEESGLLLRSISPEASDKAFEYSPELAVLLTLMGAEIERGDPALLIYASLTRAAFCIGYMAAQEEKANG